MHVRGSASCLFVRLLGPVFVSLLAVVSLHAEEAANYPTKPVVLIVPFAPSGASDFAARLLQTRLSELLGQQVIIENRDGASGNVGMEMAARKAPDGYTLFLGNVGAISVNPYVFPHLKLSPLDEFVPISLVADAPGVMVARASLPVENLAEFITYAKQRPEQVSFASAGAASINRLEMESFAHHAGIKLVHVPYKGGAGSAIKDLLGGHVDIMITAIGSVISFIKQGQLKALAVTAANRLPSLPEVPTMSEVGFPGNISSSWQGVFAPKGTPRPIVHKLHAAIVEAMQDKTIQERMADAGVQAVSSSSSDEFKEFLVKDAKKWKSVVELIGIKIY